MRDAINLFEYDSKLIGQNGGAADADLAVIQITRNTMKELMNYICME
jgi:hypothetical protein